MPKRRRTIAPRRVSWTIAALLTGAAIVSPGLALASDEPPARLLYIVREGDAVVASNVLFGRSDEFKLAAREAIARQEEGNAIVVLLTNQRLIAYSVYTAAWVTADLRAGEYIERLEAEDFSAFALTSRRILNFNGRNGRWSISKR